MRRREFITIMGGTAVSAPMAWPLEAIAQQSAMPVIGVLSSNSAGAANDRMEAFRGGLAESGFTDGQNVRIEYLWGNDQRDRLAGLAADLVRRQVAVIVGIGSGDPTRAAKTATSTIPIVFAMGGDPLGTGIISSLSRPGGNITGATWLASELIPKRLELLRDCIPGLTTIGFLLNPVNASAALDSSRILSAADTVGCKIIIMKTATADDIEAVFSANTQPKVEALILEADSLYSDRRDRIVELAARHGLPTIYPDGDYTKAGGLMSYNADILDTLRQSGLYTGRILKGGKPADLPVLQPTKFELVVNLKTAKVLGLEIPTTLLVSADEVIE